MFIEPRTTRFRKIDRMAQRQGRRADQAGYVARRAEEDRLYAESLKRPKKPSPIVGLADENPQ